MSESWNPRPCREEVKNVLEYIRDSLTSQGVEFQIEQDDINPDAFAIGALDKSGHGNFGLVGWNEEGNKVGYAAYDPVRGNHDEQEGVPEDESKCFWSPDSARVMVMFLTGEVRKIVNESRERVNA